ncbi:MAG TPA: zinc ABC transporter substrate-binding protein [Candidatus Saccharimonadia bacterium]|nr:zinc ABC transporter substrate-binding protein [Candidatus Saccharimonadia bacterium]
MNKKSVYVILVAVVVGGVLLAALAVRDRSGVTGSGKLKVVAAENFWGDIARQIGGSQVVVTSIISDPQADPHLYESSAQNAAVVGSADVVIVNGVGYDDFMDKLVAGSRNDHRVVVKAAAVTNTAEGANPHLWYDTAKVEVVAQAIEQALAGRDDAHRSVYETNLAAFMISLRSLHDEVGRIKADYAGVGVAYTEPVPAYLLLSAGLSVKTPAGFSQAIEEGNDPSPADTAGMESLITGHAIKVLLYNSQATSPVTERVKALAQKNGVSVIGVTETLPAGKDFQTWQLDQAKALYTGLSGN